MSLSRSVQSSSILLSIRSRRAGVNPDEIVAYYTGGREALEARREAAKAPARSWTWEKAKSEYSAHLANNNRQATKTDYEKKLRLPELSRFAGRSVPSITANEIAKVYAGIHSRSRSTGHAFRRVVKAFWSYLGDATRADETGVTIDLSRLKKIPDPRVEIGDPNTPFDPEEEQGDAPPEIELGRLLAISRCPDVLDPRIAYGIQLLLASAQRRRTVIGAARNRFKRYPEVPDEEAWYVPPYWRKSGSKRGKRYHLVPIVSWGAKAVYELDKLSDFEGSSGWLFPARGQGSTKPADDGLLNDYLEVSRPDACRCPRAFRGDEDQARQDNRRGRDARAPRAHQYGKEGRRDNWLQSVQLAAHPCPTEASSRDARYREVVDRN